MVFTPFVLMEKDPLTGEVVPWNDLHRQYIDGSVDGDLPMARLSEMFNVNHFIVSQVNPHVVPFLPRDEGPISDHNRQASPTSHWLQKATNLATEEVLHRMHVLSELGIFSNSLTKASSILSQKYFGDINIFPEIPYSNFSLVLKNPTTEFMLKACYSGERATWPKLARIRNHLAIELALDRAVQAMRAMVALTPVQADLRSHLHFHSGESFDSSTARFAPRRRSSYSHESERSRHNRIQSSRRPVHQLHKARSAYSADYGPFGRYLNGAITPEQAEEYLLEGDEEETNSQQPQKNYSLLKLDVDDDSDLSPPQRPALPNHSASWGPSTYERSPSLSDEHTPPRYQRSPSTGSIKQFSEPSTPRSLKVPSPSAASPPPNSPGSFIMTPVLSSALERLQ